ncbi:hypothetical protein, partial [Xanthomonas oryzae]
PWGRQSCESPGIAGAFFVCVSAAALDKRHAMADADSRAGSELRTRGQLIGFDTAMQIRLSQRMRDRSWWQTQDPQEATHVALSLLPRIRNC